MEDYADIGAVNTSAVVGSQIAHSSPSETLHRVGGQRLIQERTFRTLRGKFEL